MGRPKAKKKKKKTRKKAKKKTKKADEGPKTPMADYWNAEPYSMADYWAHPHR
jgi:hypothetical protein